MAATTAGRPSSAAAVGERANPVRGPLGEEACRREVVTVVGAAHGKQYRLGNKIRSGSFGTVYVGFDLETGEKVAVKVEPSHSSRPQLIFEARVLQSFGGTPGVPTVRWYGRQPLGEHFKCDNGPDYEYNIMVVDLLGPSLEDLFDLCGRKFSVGTVLALAGQMINQIEMVHNHLFLHRDIKPNNFLIGRGDRSHIVHIIDFGLSKKYRYPGTGKHIEYREGKSLTGTARYASINTHQGCEQSRRDDMESLGYVFMYLLRGFLPWQGISARNKKQKYARIMEKKRKTTTEELCRGFPVEFRMYINYCRQLRFEEAPDYAYLRTLFCNASRRLGHPPELLFDWELGLHNPQKTHEVSNKHAEGLPLADRNGTVVPHAEVSEGKRPPPVLRPPVVTNGHNEHTL